MSGQPNAHDVWMGRALLAFPPRWRDERGAELMEVSQALSNTADDKRPSTRELADVVRGGLTVRLRDRPPLWRRLLFHWASQPVPRQHWGWMRDQLGGRFLGLRVGLRSIWSAFVFWPLFWMQRGPNEARWLLGVAATLLAVSVLGARGNTRRFRERIHRKVGFELTTCPTQTPSEGLATALPAWPDLPPPPPRRVPEPNGRIPIRQFIWPWAFFGLVCGAAFIGGAARPNTETSVFGFHYVSDPNSPLTPAAVAQWSSWLAIGSALLVGAIFGLGWLRRRTLTHATLHPVNEYIRQAQGVALITLTTTAVPTLAVGLSGVMPDLASAVTGSTMVVGAAALAGLGLAAWHAEDRLGRPISLADLFVGEIWQRRWNGLEPGDFIGESNTITQPPN